MYILLKLNFKNINRKNILFFANKNDNKNEY